MANVPKEIVRERERKAWAMRTQNLMLQWQIAEELNITESGVCRILKRVSMRVLQEMNEDIIAYKAQQVEALMFIAQEAMAAWTKSKEPIKTVSRSVRGKQLDGETEQTDKIMGTIMRTTDQDGDPRYLTIAMAALADIRKVLGLDTVEQVILTGKIGVGIDGGAGIKVSYSDEQLATILGGLLEVGAFNERQLPAGAIPENN